jgi:mono/diheme cytochrome c family protein
MGKQWKLSSAIAMLAVLAGCETTPEPDPQQQLIERGRDLFFNETFDGNGRTCGTCHRAENNLTIEPAFIATLPDDDPLFVAETNPALMENFENPRLMREFGLIVENLDGFDDLENVFVMRGVPHTLALQTSIESPAGPRTGWSGDGAPGDGTLRSFAIGAVIQHFPKTLGRVAGVDFRLPDDEELDALEAFQLSTGRESEISLPLPLKGTVVTRGQEIFLDNALGKCNICHRDAGANAVLGGADLGNANFNTGVEAIVDQPARLTGEKVPLDDGLGRPGDGTFNTPPLVEAADTGPFFHNNSIETIEGAVAFYNSDAFNDSPAGQFLAGLDPNGVGIALEATQVVEVAAFLRAINALENVREGEAQLTSSITKGFDRRADAKREIAQAVAEIDDGIMVLAGGGLSPAAVGHLREARRLADKASRSWFSRKRLSREAIAALQKARDELIATS